MLKNPANRHHAVGFTFEQWHYAFTNTFTEEDAAASTSATTSPRRGDLLGRRAGQHPSRQGRHWVDYHNANRAPLLFISGSDDHMMPPQHPAVERQALQVRTLITEVKEFDGPHLLPSGRAGRQSPTTPSSGPCPRPASRARDAESASPTSAVRRRSWRSTGGASSPTPRSTIPAAPTTSAGARRHARPPARRSRLPTSGRSTLYSSPTTTTPTTSTTPAGRCCRRCRSRHDDRRSAAPRRHEPGLEPWADHHLEQPGRPTIEITATPCRHGPPLSRPLTGDVIGFALRWDGQHHGVVWMSGDTVLYDGVRDVADRLDVGVAILHLGEARFGLPDRCATR